MVLRLFPLLLAVVVSAFLLAQLAVAPVGDQEPAMAQTPAASAPVMTEDMVESRTIAPGERTVLMLQTTGVVDVVIFEETEAAEFEAFQAGQVPRTAKVFTGVKALAYPLASQTGATFHVRVHHSVPGATTLHYEVGTSEEAMNQLRKGENLLRNRGTIVAEGLYLMPLYQLVPGTIVKVEPKAGQGTIALLKTRDYLTVKRGEKMLADLCADNPCVSAGGEQNNLEFYLDDYDDRYLAVQTETESLEFSYTVLATPEVLNYIVSCG
jgi:hypothetical protein